MASPLATGDERDTAAAPVAVLANPTAGRGRSRALIPAVLDRLRAGARPVRVLEAGTVTEATAACRAAIGEGAGALVTVGGDGTVHAGIQAVAGTGIPFGAVPVGTGNDFAVDVGMHATPVVAAEAIADALRHGRTHRVDLARMAQPDGSQRWYGAVLAAGFDAVVNEKANRMRFPSGPRRYDLAIMIELLRLRPRRYTLTLDDEVIEVEAVLVAVGNTASYGGGMRICPAADPTDGMLDVLVGGRLSRYEVIRIKPRLRYGTHVGQPKVDSYRAHTVRVAAEGIVAYADGERACPLPVTVTCVPGALTVLGADARAAPPA